MNQCVEAFQRGYDKINSFYYQKIDGNKKLEMIVFLISLILIGVLLFRLNQPTPWVVDDIIKGEEVKNLHGIQQWFAHLYHFYFFWGGRVWGELYAYLFLAMPKGIFNYLNTVGYVAFLLLIYINITGRFKFSPSLIILINFLLFACLPAFGQDILWISGCANYMWASLIPLLFLAFMRFYYNKPQAYFSKMPFCIFFFLLGIMAGWANENVSVSLILIMMGYMFIFYKSGKKSLCFTYAGMAGLVIGSAFLWLAPGNFVRFAAGGYSKSIVHMIGKMWNNAVALFNYESTLLLIVAFLILMIFSKSDNKKLSVVFMLGSFLASIAFSVVGSIQTRVFLGVVVLMCISVGILFDGWEDDKKVRGFKFLLTFALFLGTMSFYSTARGGIIDYSRRWEQNLKIIQMEKARGNLDVYVNPVTPRNKFCAAYGLEDIQTKENNQHWLNQGVAYAFDLHTIQSVKVDPLQQ